jgi:hypothetical protein
LLAVGLVGGLGLGLLLDCARVAMEGLDPAMASGLGFGWLLALVLVLTE